MAQAWESRASSALACFVPRSFTTRQAFQAHNIVELPVNYHIPKPVSRVQMYSCGDARRPRTVGHVCRQWCAKFNARPGLIPGIAHPYIVGIPLSQVHVRHTQAHSRENCAGCMLVDGRLLVSGGNKNVVDEDGLAAVQASDEDVDLTCREKGMVSLFLPLLFSLPASRKGAVSNPARTPWPLLTPRTPGRACAHAKLRGVRPRTKAVVDIRTHGTKDAEDRLFRHTVRHHCGSRALFSLLLSLCPPVSRSASPGNRTSWPWLAMAR